ncbi:MAG: hypothetical protein WCX95_02465 [Candidatus Gracilibacteria bacterium]
MNSKQSTSQPTHLRLVTDEERASAEGRQDDQSQLQSGEAERRTISQGTQSVHDLALNRAEVQGPGEEEFDWSGLDTDDDEPRRGENDVPRRSSGDNVVPFFKAPPTRTSDHDFSPDESRRPTVELPVGYIEELNAKGDDHRRTTVIPGQEANYPAQPLAEDHQRVLREERIRENFGNQTEVDDMINRAREAGSYTEAETILIKAIQTRSTFLTKNRPNEAKIFSFAIRNLSAGTFPFSARGFKARDLEKHPHGFNLNILFATEECLFQKLKEFPPRPDLPAEDKMGMIRDFWTIVS